MPPTQDVQPVTPITPPATVQNPTNVVSLGELQNPTPIVEAPPIQMQDFTKFTQQFQANTAQEQAGVDTARQNIRDIGGQLATQGQRGAQLDEQFGLNAAYDQSAQLNDQIAQLSNAFNLAITNEEGVARPIEFITGRQAFLQRQKATQLEALAATQAALNGNIALAEQRVATALEREFGDLEALLDTQLFELDQNKEALTAKDAKATAELERALLERSRQLEVQKENKKQILNYATEAASNGAPNEITSRITQASSPEEALALAGQYVGLLDRQQTQASIAASNAGIAQGWARVNLAEREFAYGQQKDAVANEIAALKASGELTEKQAQDQTKVESALRLQDLTKQIRGHAGFNLSVGSLGSRLLPTEGGLPGQLFNVLSGQGEGFDALYDQLTESLTLDNLDKMSGVLTDRDISVLRSAATRLRKTTTETEFLNTLDEMDSVFQRTVDERGVTPQQAKFYYGIDDSSLSEIDSIFNSNSTAPNTSSFDF